MLFSIHCTIVIFHRCDFLPVCSCLLQYIFGTRIGDVSALSNQQVYDRAVAGAAQVQLQFTALPLAPALALALAPPQDHQQEQQQQTLLPTMRLLDHGHFVNYGGKHLAWLCSLPS